MNEQVNYAKIQRIQDDLEALTIGTFGTGFVTDAMLYESGIKATVTQHTSDLADVTTYDVFYRKPKTGKKIVFIGDSTTDNATDAHYIYDRLNSIYTVTGGLLEGASIIPRGSNGGTLQNFIADYVGVNGCYSGNTLTACVNDQADLYIISYGINDIRAGVNSPGRTQTQIRADLKTAIDRLLNETNGSILLRIQHPFLTVDVGSQGWVSPNSNAEEYSNQLWDISESFRDYSNRLDIIDLPNLIFGKQSLPQHPYMKDQLHPNPDGYRAIADEIAEHISGKKKKDLCNMDNYEVVLKGSIESTAISNTYISFFTASYEDVRLGDVIIVGNSWSFVVEQQPVKNNNKWFITHSHTGGFLGYGTVKVLRKKKRPLTTIEETNNWNRAFIESTNLGYNTKFIVDLNSYSLGTLTTANIYARLTYFTKDTSLSNIKVTVYFNNNPNNYLDTPVTASLPLVKTIIPNVVDGYESQVTADITGKRYAHVIIYGDLTNNSGLKNINFKDFIFSINSHSIDLSNVLYMPWNIFSTARSYIQSNFYGENVLPTVPDMVDILKTTPQSNWVKSNTNTTDTQIFFETVIDLNSYSATTDLLIEIATKYFTDNANIKNVGFSYYINNVATVGQIGGGVVGDGKFINAVINEIANYYDNFYIATSGNRYLHLLLHVNLNTGNTNNNNIDFGDVILKCNKNNVDFTSKTWSLFGSGAGSTITNGIYRNDTVVTIDVLKKLGLIT